MNGPINLAFYLPRILTSSFRKGSPNSNHLEGVGVAVSIITPSTTTPSRKACIILLNSKSDEALDMHVPKQNVRTLRRILITKLDEESHGKLVQLYRKNLDFWIELGYATIEILDGLGTEAAPVMLSAEENKVYTQLKNGSSPVRTVGSLSNSH